VSVTENTNNQKSGNQKSGIPWALTLLALGVVFGDIGTSPLYALRECFTGSHGVPLNNDNILGVLSLVFWSLIIVIAVKYLLVVLYADNKGEGGVLALMALANPQRSSYSTTKRRTIVYLGLFGAALLYGDGIITPAISVLGALEGLKIATPLFDPYIVPLALFILFWLFYFQKHGTDKIGKVFGPIIVLWFSSLGVLGARWAFETPLVFHAFNPIYAIQFFIDNGSQAFRALGGVFLVVTGGEALYADMGHFGRRPIKIAWFFFVLPALILNYLGQGALLLINPSAIENPFYRLAPTWAVIPLVVLAAFATVIASQAVISGAFSLTRQAVQLGYLPRIEIRHTSHKEIGQIYVGLVNWLLMILTMWLVVEFKSSSNLASAYGIAVSATMVITTILVFFVARRVWRWNWWVAFSVTLFFLSIDFVYFGANFIKLHDGGWVPLTIAATIFIITTTWQRGRLILAARLSEGLIPLEHFIKGLVEHPPIRIPGTAIFMCRNNQKVPPALMHNVKHNKVLNERVILLMVTIDDIPYVDASQRVKIEEIEAGFIRVTANFGFMEYPNIPDLLRKLPAPYTISDLFRVTFFVGKETLFATDRPGMALWREKIFAFLSRNSQPATNFFNIPTERVVEIGLQVEL
jgi:KUP system potassium uptake protein